MTLCHKVRLLYLMQSFETSRPSSWLSSKADSLETVETCSMKRVLVIPMAQEHCSCRISLAKLSNVETSRTVRISVRYYMIDSILCFLIPWQLEFFLFFFFFWAGGGVCFFGSFCCGAIGISYKIFDVSVLWSAVVKSGWEKLHWPFIPEKWWSKNQIETVFYLESSIL